MNFKILHALRYKAEIHEFVMGHFLPILSFDLEQTVYLFTSGRYEYKNKGFRSYVGSLGPAQTNSSIREKYRCYRNHVLCDQAGSPRYTTGYYSRVP